MSVLKNLPIPIVEVIDGRKKSKSSLVIVKSGELKGRKFLAKHENLVANFKKRYCSRSNLQKSKSSIHEEMNIGKRSLSFQNSNFQTLSQNISENNKINYETIAYADEKRFLPTLQKKQAPTFSSSNFDKKMNEYLNIILKKNIRSYVNDKMPQKVKNQEVQNSKCLNKFLRKMKLSQNKRKSDLTSQKYNRSKINSSSTLKQKASPSQLTPRQSSKRSNPFDSLVVPSETKNLLIISKKNRGPRIPTPEQKSFKSLIPPVKKNFPLEKNISFGKNCSLEKSECSQRNVTFGETRSLQKSTQRCQQKATLLCKPQSIPKLPQQSIVPNASISREMGKMDRKMNLHKSKNNHNTQKYFNFV